MMRAWLVVLIVAVCVTNASPVVPARPSPSAAIVFVHAGASLRALHALYALRRPFGLGIRPRQPYSVEISKEAPDHGLESVLDLPADAAAPDMSDSEIRSALWDDFLTAPGVVGVHVEAGSGAFADARTIRDVLDVARARGAWVLATDGDDAARLSQVARGLGVPVLVATDDLDAQATPDAIAARVRALIARARETGEAIGVARLETPALGVIGALLPAFDRAEVRLVPPSAFLR